MKIKSLFTPLVKRAASLFLTAAAGLLFQAAVVQPAYAHHIIVSASAVCTNGAAFINYTATSWDPTNSGAPGDGENPAINVTFDGVTVDTEPFIAPAGTFSGTRPFPNATPTVDVSANTTSLWKDGFDPANDAPTNVVTVTFPANCAPPPGVGRFTGGGKQVAAGVDALGNTVTITKGFEVDCDLHQPSNNLEIHWGGNQFHMTAFTAAVCTSSKVVSTSWSAVTVSDATAGLVAIVQRTPKSNIVFMPQGRPHPVRR